MLNDLLHSTILVGRKWLKLFNNKTMLRINTIFSVQLTREWDIGFYEWIPSSQKNKLILILEANRLWMSSLSLWDSHFSLPFKISESSIRVDWFSISILFSNTKSLQIETCSLFLAHYATHWKELSVRLFVPVEKKMKKFCNLIKKNAKEEN